MQKHPPPPVKVPQHAYNWERVESRAVFIIHKISISHENSSFCYHGTHPQMTMPPTGNGQNLVFLLQPRNRASGLGVRPQNVPPFCIWLIVNIKSMGLSPPPPCLWLLWRWWVLPLIGLGSGAGNQSISYPCPAPPTSSSNEETNQPCTACRVGLAELVVRL